MKVLDSVNESISQYPTLYLTKNYEHSKFLVLNHMFIVIGNGYEWAVTKNPKRGGYLTDEWSKKRKYNTPYGKKKCDVDITKFFTEDVYELKKIDHNETLNFLTYSDELLKASPKLKKWFIRYVFEYPKVNRVFTTSTIKDIKVDYITDSQDYNPKCDWHLLKIKRNDVDCFGEKFDRQSVTPYPNFNKRFSEAWQTDFIQDDWKIEAINLYSYWKDFFVAGKDDDYYYPSEKRISNFINDYKTNGYYTLENLESMAKTYGFSILDINFDEPNTVKPLLEARWEGYRKDVIEFCDETIYKLLKL